MHQMFLVQLWKKATITGHFGLVLQEIFSSEITWLSCSCRFEKFCCERFITNEVYKCFSLIFSHISSVLLCLKLMKLNQLGQWIVFNLPDYKRPVYVTPERFQNGRIHSENAWNVFRSHYAHEEEIWKGQQSLIWICASEKSWAVKSHGYRAVAVSKSPFLRGLFRVQMFFTNIFPDTSVVLTCFKLM